MSNEVEEYGFHWACINWNANVVKAGLFLDATGFQLRWYGITIFLGPRTSALVFWSGGRNQTNRIEGGVDGWQFTS